MNTTSATSPTIDPLPAHFPLSPSKAYIWLNCPAAKNMPPSPSTPAAEAGSAGHAASEKLLAAGTFTGLDLFLCEEEAYAGAREHVAPSDARAIAAAAVTYVEELIRLAPPWSNLHVEKKIAHPTITGFGGTIDCLFVAGDHLAIFDLKTGKWPAHFEQLACYALLARSEYERPIVDATIIQPRAIDGNTIQRRTWDEQDLNDFEYRVIDAAADDSDARHPGPHCRWCTLKDTCPAYDPKMLVSF